ncbi:NPCBM/NEW2 domain-containing protein [Deinococcus sp. QL22]|uniref:NPCBM/NEW2 domain-containing protein n=1 Tax=Deinococcus sp. QL22 TaxID=2939437 RepID=UPI002017286B|nr:NPCBM/NEW2 domain-containing protein [Deinococcus sp. QL22]UQN10635.1 NPCBM/NEW2 domain-containing protein [Deinococcus sp. QL22]
MPYALPRLLVGLTLPLALWSCSQPTPFTAADPYANGQSYPWSQVTPLTPQSLTPGLNTLQYETALFARNSWGPVERNRSNGEQQAGDGNPLTLNGKVYSQGYGVHAGSEMRFSLKGTNGAQCTRFTVDVGVDDEVGARGSVIFKVLLDGQVKHTTTRLTGNSPTQQIDLNITGAQELTLIAEAAGDGIDYDHADWADPKLVCVTPSSETPGSLDPSFDGDGVVQQPTDSPQAFGEVSQLTSGQLVTHGPYMISRYNANGTLDLTFGQSGRAHPIGPPSQIFDLDTQPDGHVLFSGIRREPYQGFVERLLPSGLPDLSFGGQGNGTLTLAANAYHLAVQPDGRFLTAGFSAVAGAPRLVVRRFQANGTPDQTYGSSGVVMADVGLKSGEGYSVEEMLIQADGKLIVGATAGPSFPETSFHVTRLLPNGQLDSSFDGDGWLTSRPQGLAVEMTDLALTPAGQLIVTGGVVASGDQQGEGKVARYTSSGNLDPTFGTSGVVSFDGFSTVKGAAVQTDGRVLLIFLDYGTAVARDVVRLQADGRLDTSFGSGGQVQFQLQGLSFGDVTLQSDGRIILSGGSGGVGSQSADLVRLFP